jgi:predicted CoA-binding protein
MTTNNQDLINEFLDKQNVFAVVGVSTNTEKYGHKIFFDLKNAGYIVYPINPKSSHISDERCYPSLTELPVVPDVADIVVPPKITEKTVKECKELGIKKVWMQPGSESDDAIRFCRENKIKVLHSVCVMMERRKNCNEI